MRHLGLLGMALWRALVISSIQDLVLASDLSPAYKSGSSSRPCRGLNHAIQSSFPSTPDTHMIFDPTEDYTNQFDEPQEMMKEYDSADSDELRSFLDQTEWYGRGRRLRQGGNGIAVQEEKGDHLQADENIVVNARMTDKQNKDNEGSSSMTSMEASKNRKKKKRRPTTPYALSLREDLNYFNHLYESLSGLSRVAARYRIRTKLTPDIAKKLDSANAEEINQAIQELGKIDADDLLGIQKRKFLNNRLIAYMQLARDYVRRITKLGMPLFPPDRVEELFHTDASIWQPAVRLLYTIARNFETVKRKEIQDTKKALLSQTTK